MTVAERVREHRAAMRARGYRVVQTWVPDVRTAEFAQEADRQATAVAEADQKTDDQDFIDAVSAEWE